MACVWVHGTCNLQAPQSGGKAGPSCLACPPLSSAASRPPLLYATIASQAAAPGLRALNMRRGPWPWAIDLHSIHATHPHCTISDACQQFLRSASVGLAPSCGHKAHGPCSCSHSQCADWLLGQLCAQVQGCRPMLSVVKACMSSMYPPCICGVPMGLQSRKYVHQVWNVAMMLPVVTAADHPAGAGAGAGAVRQAAG